MRKCLLMLLAVLGLSGGLYAATCKGHFVNPTTDVCWDCIFPITIGSSPVAAGTYPDTSNPASPICICPVPPPIFERIGVTIGFWEPFALVDVTRDPYCMVNMGTQLHVKDQGLGGSEMPSTDGRGAFYYVHWYKYPVVYWLNIITNVGCVQTGDFDLAYMTELDPTWNDDELAFVLNPEASLLSNPITQTACAADALITSTDSMTAIDALFWCLGSQGSVYPLTGNVANQASPIQAATKLAERMDFKMHREGLVWDSVGADSPAVCNQYPSPIMPKSRYRYQLVNTIPDALQCHPFGHLVATFETGHVNPADGDNYGFLIFRKRNCCFM
ncbi:conjugal transfer pilus assembly protein TraU (plasmid) [Piscirickettsia salmonis]|uniref:conjugal transfer pilus assembly protein TraU n=1 Tax=Piscirickettsia salmonis TaxID=1238 RepID=UPI0006BC3E97|nr:conjugal transfer protein TraU [Piscirickettsia salmonis]APS45858.1 conjugal transfer protein TraU [Piscirickettsia salmonis]APS49259.1 conjugal transfer protein TraU [Piscirickettsia salmonis]QGO82354.1 conjugal transfer pilus assembly protein TraU [Piscirickettsia salmonis]QGP24183.1 conjugal transfer pilus assembly protein TraU [Piscirickettsia salmonis]